MNPAHFARSGTRLCLILAALALGYMWLRFDQLRLPADGCSPLLRFAPGDRLLLDRWPQNLLPRQAVLFQAPAGGGLELGLVRELREIGPSGEQELWLEVDDKNCGGRASETYGWLPESAIVARILLVLPW